MVREPDLSPETAAREMGVSRTTIYELLTRGELQSYHVGRSRRITRTSLDDYKVRQQAPAGRLGAARTAGGVV